VRENMEDAENKQENVKEKARKRKDANALNLDKKVFESHY
jgi:hypothetical protein